MNECTPERNTPEIAANIMQGPGHRVSLQQAQGQLASDSETSVSHPVPAPCGEEACDDGMNVTRPGKCIKQRLNLVRKDVPVGHGGPMRYAVWSWLSNTYFHFRCLKCRAKEFWMFGG